MSFKQGLKNYIIAVVIIVIVIGSIQLFAIKSFSNINSNKNSEPKMDIPIHLINTNYSQNLIAEDNNIEKTNDELCIEVCSPDRVLFYDITYEPNIKDNALICVCDNEDTTTAVYDLNKKKWIQR